MLSKEKLEEIGIDLSKENNNELSLTANLEYEKYKEHNNTESSVYFAFGPADYICFIDQKAYGEIQAVKVDTIANTLELDVVYFAYKKNHIDNSAEEANKYKRIKGATFTEIYTNEEKAAMHRVLSGVNYLGEHSNVDVNRPLNSTTFVFKFKDITDFKSGVPDFLNK